MTKSKLFLCALLLASLTIAASATQDPPHVMPNPRPTTDPWTGHHRALVLLIDWKNREHVIDAAKVERTIFGMEPGDASIRQYFLENSGGKMDITGKVLGWKKLKQSWSHLNCLKGDDVGNWLDDWKGCNPKRVANLAWDAFKSEVNIKDYDSDGDGKIDHLYVVHSGRIWKNRVGPDRVFYYSSPMANEAVVFQSQGLGKVGNEIPIGFYLHESGHELFLLGDYYGIDYKKGQYGIGMWGIMGLGAWGVQSSMPREELFRNPAHYEPASKVRNGWANAQVFTRTARHVRLRPVETSADIAVVPMGVYQQTSFFLEYRTARGFSAKLPGHGLLLWKGWELIQADGRDDLNHGHILKHRPLPPNDENFGDASDPFPGSLGVTSYTDPDSGIRFENITQTDEAIELDIVFPGVEIEAKSIAALGPSLRTYSTSFHPVTINGEAW